MKLSEELRGFVGGVGMGLLLAGYCLGFFFLTHSPKDVAVWLCDRVQAQCTVSPEGADG